MDEGLTDDQEILLDATTRFIEATCPRQRLREGAHEDVAFLAAYRRQAAELGWFSLVVTESLGGGNVSGNGVVDASLVGYRRGRLLQPAPFVGTNVVAFALARAGSEEQQATVLPALLSGEVSAAAVLDARRGWVEDPGPDGWLLVTAPSGDGASQFLVPVDGPGVSAVRLDGLDLTRRFLRIEVDVEELPPTALVGAAGSADELVQDELALASVLTAAESVGAMDAELAFTVQYAKDRIAFGRPIGSFQAIKHALADTSLDLEMSKAIVAAAAAHVGSGDAFGRQAASMAKSFVGDAGIELAQTCFQVFGGIGFTWEHDQHLYLRRLTTDSQLFGDPTWHRERVCQLQGV